jgi:putative transposase
MEVQVSAGQVGEFGYHVVWCSMYRRRFLAARLTGRCDGLNRAKASEHDWRILVLEITPDQVRLFVKAHRSGPSSQIADHQFKGVTPRQLWAELPHLRSRLPALRCRPCFAATVGAVSFETVRRYTGPHTERPWQQERHR